MTLEELGYNAHFENYRQEQKLDSFDMGRVVAEYKERYLVKTDTNEFEAEITGNLRFSAQTRFDFPAVGDWVALLTFDKNNAIIHKIFPRRTILERQAIGKFAEKQIIATNIDYAFLIQAVDRDFNINRLERYLTISHATFVEPIIVLNKIDLIDEIDIKNMMNELNTRIENVPILFISNETKEGYEELITMIKKGKTYCFLGSSGVGKSTLINNISGKELMKTSSISASTKKGRHVTSHRELIVLEGGGILIDNPGMREIGIADAAEGLEITFDTIIEISRDCKFADCTHTHEKGCAVVTALEKGLVDKASYDNYLKMERETARFNISIAEKRKKDKNFGKVCKEALKIRKQNKF